MICVIVWVRNPALTIPSAGYLPLLVINKAIMCVRLRRPIFQCSISTCVDVAAEVFDEYLKSIKQKVYALKEAFAIWSYGI